MSWSERSRWIWVQEAATADSYADFYSEFTYTGGETCIQISADSNYALFINGTFVDSGQYPDFPHYKVYDRIDITKYCKPGLNQLAVTVWYYGIVGSSTYFKGEAALRFEVYQDVALCAWSAGTTLSRKNQNYISQKKLITPQLGLTFCYDATCGESWRTGADDTFTESREVEQSLSLFERPVDKYRILPRTNSVLVKQEENYRIYDLGREEVGYLTLRVKSPIKQKITIGFGEHLADGKVRWINNGRDFSVSVIVDAGITEYTNYFRRLGLRYLEVIPEGELQIEYVSVLPCEYPLNRIGRKFESPIQQQIYDTSVRTLELCMHEHYEDCPWREQALYAMDSRNQILCGYYAFEEYRFPRANLLLIGKSLRPDGLLPICAPSDLALTIPSFSLHYFTEVLEYTRYSADRSLAREVLPVLKTILQTFLDRMEDGLVAKLDGKEHWNFYEWTKDLSDDTRGSGVDAVLNCLISRALATMQELSDMLQIPANYLETAERLNRRIREEFFQPETGLYVNDQNKNTYSELANALAVLCGAAKGGEARAICRELANGGKLVRSSLSMRCFKYDALLKEDYAAYREYIIRDIVATYEPMLAAGATSFWETELGEKDFCGAGSLCHGWSAIPAYYLTVLHEKV